MEENGLLPIALCLALALAAAPLVHGMAAGINRSLGQLWPFTLTHCRTPTTPGCAPPRQLAWHVR